MVSFMIKHKNLLLLLTVLFFVGSLGFVGAGVFIEEYGPNAAIAKVGDTKIKYKDYLQAVNLVDREARNSEKYTEESINQIKQEVLQQMINEESLSQAANAFGIGTSDMEIGYTIQNSPLFNKGGLFNKKAYVWIVRNTFNMNPAQYEENLKKQKLAAKFQNLIILSAKVPQQELEMLYKAEGKNAKEIEKNKDAFALAAVQLKAQSLMNKYTDGFNAKGNIQVFDKSEQQNGQE